MQFSLFVAGFISALSIGAASASKLDMRLTAPKAPAKRGVLDECTPENDCCLSTKGACQRQSEVWAEAWIQCNVGLKICPDYGVSWDACKADCCSISGKSGRGCPGK